MVETLSSSNKSGARSAIARQAAPQEGSRRVFFPALSSLRFIAAFGVFFHHIEINKFRCGLPNLVNNYTLAQLGPQGVNLFFVLSSFLLTYLLLQEHRQTGSIGIKQFYARRMLRIWPLYFLIIAIAFLAVPLAAPFLLHAREVQYALTAKPHLLQAFCLYLLMLPNLAEIVYPRIIGASQAWSLGVEEQFYLFWPLLVKLFRRRPILLLVTFLSGTLLVANCAKALPAATHTLIPGLPEPSFVSLWTGSTFVYQTALHLRMMFFGALAAVLFSGRNPKVRSVAYHPLFRIFTVTAICLLMMLPYKSCDVPLGLLFSALILSLTDAKLKIMTAPSLVYLGTISYGIYMFHPIVLECYMKLSQKLDLLSFNLLIYATALPLTIAISALSYRFWERPFLRLKTRHSVMESGVN